MMFDELNGVRIETTTNGSSYWSWFTPHAFSLGIGRRPGDIDAWKFGAPSSPDGLPDEPGVTGWQGPLEEDHPDWFVT